MKRLFSMMLIMVSMMCVCSSCSEDEIYVPQEVAFTLDYTFAESGSMTRATGEEVYSSFYDKYIKTKQLTPTTYSLTFTNKETGSSAPRIKTGSPSDTVYISFSETIHMTKDMTNLTLTAIYDSYLLLFDAQNISKCRFIHDTSNNSQTYINKDLNNTGEVFNLFIKDFNYTTSTYRPFVELTRPDGMISKIYLNKFPFEKGKYYYFNDMTNSFDIPKMESGN